MATIRFGNVILCEHVVKGENNKHTLVNTYSGDIVVSSMPARLNLGLYVEMMSDVDSALTMEVYRGDDVVLTGEFTVARKATSAPAVLIVPIFGFAADTEDSIKVTLRADGFRRTTVLEKRIIIGPLSNQPATTNPPPA